MYSIWVRTSSHKFKDIGFKFISRREFKIRFSVFVSIIFFDRSSLGKIKLTIKKIPSTELISIKKSSIANCQS